MFWTFFDQFPDEVPDDSDALDFQQIFRSHDPEGALDQCLSREQTDKISLIFFLETQHVD